MTESPLVDPVLSGIFAPQGLSPSSFDEAALKTDDKLKVVFFWGTDCPNCGVAKEQMKQIADELRQMPVEFHTVDAYTHMELATRFGLFGIPVFLFFKKGRLIGKVTSFPSREEFLAVLRRFM